MSAHFSPAQRQSGEISVTKPKLTPSGEVRSKCNKYLTNNNLRQSFQMIGSKCSAVMVAPMIFLVSRLFLIFARRVLPGSMSQGPCFGRIYLNLSLFPTMIQ